MNKTQKINYLVDREAFLYTSELDNLERKRTLKVSGKILDLQTPKVMGILNITPDSFYSGSRHSSVESALQQARQMLADGATIIDVGGYSSRPGADEVSEEEEKKRVVPVIRHLRESLPEVVISVDTFRSG
ncbi:MAG: dihydropteroate synthase, partial [Bacteroidota bacterium]